MKYTCNRCDTVRSCSIDVLGGFGYPEDCPFPSNHMVSADWREVKNSCSCSGCDSNSEIESGCGACEESCDFEALERGSILKEAYKIINGERQDTYGNPEDSFSLIGKYWVEYLSANDRFEKKGSVGITARNVAEMMMLLKIARMSGQKPSTDNYADLAGYAGIAADMVDK